MITRAVLVLIIAAVLGGCDASGGPQSGSDRIVEGGKPVIEIVGGDSVDWGSVAPGILKRVVQITNTGTDTLHITEVKPSCGCTTAPLDKNMLLPGDTAHLEVSVDVANSSGQIVKNMTINSNDSARPSISMQLKANLVRKLTAIPEFFPVPHDARPGTESVTSVALKNTGELPISVGPPTLSDAAEMIVRFDMTTPVVIQPGDSTTLVARVKPLKPGVVSADVKVPTDNKEMPTMNVRLTVDVK